MYSYDFLDVMMISAILTVIVTSNHFYHACPKSSFFIIKICLFEDTIFRAGSCNGSNSANDSMYLVFVTYAY